MKSETCSPWTSTTLRRWPVLIVKATLLLGGMVFSGSMHYFKRADPVAPVLATAVLKNLRCVAIVSKHRIDGAGIRKVALPDNFFHFFVPVLFSQLLELSM